MAYILWELFDILLSIICWIGKVTIASIIAFACVMMFLLPWIITYGESITTLARTANIVYDVLLGCVLVALWKGE